MQLKQIDNLILKGFFSPFFMTFFVALFVFIMQFFWKYIDDIVGKGLDVSIILELIFYLSMSLVPLALPISVLISSVMVMGGMGERYELASLKSAGVSLSRAMAPLFVVSLIIMVISFVFADIVIPYSNLKFQTRLYDIQRQKATLNIEEGIFNSDFKGFSIRVKEKGDNDTDLKDVMIYDQSKNTNNPSQILAKSGQMYGTGENLMVMKLFDGTQYQALQESKNRNSGKFPYMRIKFKTWQKVFDMSQFDLEETDEGAFENHYRMLNSRTLLTRVDSLKIRWTNTEYSMLRKSVPFISTLQLRDTVIKQLPLKSEYFKDTTVTSILALIPNAKRIDALNKARTLATRMKDYGRGSERTLKNLNITIIRHYNELYRKVTYAIACFIFLFIGAPMGAIVRKGGFGWPILISIVFFVLFLVLSLVGERLSQNYVLSPFWGMMLPIFIILPIGFFLTQRAMNDSKSLSMETYTNFFRKIGDLFKKKEK
jgi:lipopolysaccharide export system permease protein